MRPLTPTPGRLPIAVQLLPGGLFTLGLLFVPESPRFLAYRLVRRERARAAESLPAKGRFPDEAPLSPPLKEEVPESKLDIEEAGPSKLTDVVKKPSSLQLNLPVAPEKEPTSIHLYGSIVWQIWRKFKSQGPPRTDEDLLRALSTLAYLRREPLESPTLRSEMAEIYAQIDEIEAERAKGKATWLELLKKASNRRRLMATGFVGAWQIWTAQTAILYYACVYLIDGGAFC